ncbi:MAG: hypothetical protein IPM97_15450 [Bdellovibrionaceae bacterium]|nr:hypothetical protein [Pseudobdellovibrionaceae bacterium]
MIKYLFVILMGTSTYAMANPTLLGTWYTAPIQKGSATTLNSITKYEDTTMTMQAVLPGKSNKVVAKFLYNYDEGTFSIVKVLSKTNCPDFKFGSFEGYKYYYSVSENLLEVIDGIGKSYSTRATPEQITSFEELTEGCN